MPSRTKYFAAVIAAFTIWGTMSIALRNLQQYAPLEILYYRVFISLGVILCCSFLFRKKQLHTDLQYLRSLSPKSKGRVFLLILISAICLICNWFTFIYAVNLVSLKAAAFAYMVCPIITAIFGYFFLKEKLSTLQFTGIFIALMSISILSTGSVLDVIWAILIAIFYAVYLIIQKKIPVLDRFNLLGMQLFIASVFILPFYIINLESIPQEPHFWLMIALIAVVFTVIPLFLNGYALLGLPSSTVGMVIYINPIIAFAVAFLYFKEQSNAQQIFAYALLALAVVVFNWNLIFNPSKRKYNLE